MYKFNLTHLFHRKVILIRRMATYGIETPHGIYCLSKKTDLSVNALTSEVANQNLKLFIPKSNQSRFSKLMILDKFCKQLLLTNVKFYMAFTVMGNIFEKAVCIPNEDNLKEILHQHDLMEKIVFECKGKHFVSKSSSGSHNLSGEEEYILTRYLGYHPIIDSNQYRPVYTNYESAVSSLQQISEFETATNLLRRINDLVKQPINCVVQPQHNFIVVEGLDGTGKSTATKNIAKYLNGVPMATPPPSISNVRKKFDTLPELYRRSYYALGNYIASQEVLRVLSSKTVVMDRFWHSTTSYAIAKEVGCGVDNHIPPKDHSILKWPDDLLRPSAIIFLTTKEKDRHTRVEERSVTTEEERHISASKDLRARILEIYRRIGYSKWIEVDTSGTPNETLAKAIEGLKMNGIC